MDTRGTVLSVAGGALSMRDLAVAALTGPLACHAAPIVTVGDAAPTLRAFEQQEAARIEREAEAQRQRERQAVRFPSD